MNTVKNKIARILKADDWDDVLKNSRLACIECPTDAHELFHIYHRGTMEAVGLPLVALKVFPNTQLAAQVKALFKCVTYEEGVAEISLPSDFFTWKRSFVYGDRATGIDDTNPIAKAVYDFLRYARYGGLRGCTQSKIQLEGMLARYIHLDDILKDKKKMRSQAQSFISNLTIKKCLYKICDPCCVRCGAIEDLETDHHRPVRTFPALASTFDNLQPLCHMCNTWKGMRNLPYPLEKAATEPATSENL